MGEGDGEGGEEGNEGGRKGESLGGWIRRAGEKRMGLRGIMGVKYTDQRDRLDVGSHKKTVSSD